MATELETSLLAKTGREGAASPVVAASDDLQVRQCHSFRPHQAQLPAFVQLGAMLHASWRSSGRRQASNLSAQAMALRATHSVRQACSCTHYHTTAMCMTCSVVLHRPWWSRCSETTPC